MNFGHNNSNSRFSGMTEINLFINGIKHDHIEKLIRRRSNTVLKELRITQIADRTTGRNTEGGSLAQTKMVKELTFSDFAQIL